MPRLFNDEQESPKRVKLPWWRRMAGDWGGINVLHGPAYPTRRIAARATFVALLALSSLFGVLCGLMLVYSIDLPQMEGNRGEADFHAGLQH